MNVQELINRTGDACKARGWGKDWARGGCYIHLEVSEFIEALRGKGNPVEECADVFITIFAVMDHYGITADQVEDHMRSKLLDIENYKCGDGKK